MLASIIVRVLAKRFFSIMNHKLRSLLLPAIIACFVVDASADEPDRRGSTDAIFPAELETWKDAADPLAQGVVKAEGLRQRLISPDANGKVPVDAVAKTIDEFQKAMHLEESLRYPVSGFDVAGERLLKQIRGDHDLPATVFDSFDGRWFGRWDGNDVNHDWRPSKVFAPPRKMDDQHSPIESLQYAWISNGFGWNYLSARDGDVNHNYVMGMVYYFAHPNYRDIIEEKAHVGFADGPTRLIWITEFEIYLEEAFPRSQTGQPDCYVITGLRHDLLGASARVSRQAVQATYTREPSQRPEFQKITWTPKAQQ